MSTARPCTPEARENHCVGAGAGDGGNRGDGQSATPAGSKLVFDRQGEFARELLCCMLETGTMADLEVVIDDSCSIRCHIEVLVRVSGYFRTLLQGNLAVLASSLPARRAPQLSCATQVYCFIPARCVCLSVSQSLSQFASLTVRAKNKMLSYRRETALQGAL